MDIYSSGIQPHKIYTVEQSVGARGDVTARTCILEIIRGKVIRTCLLYTSDAADDSRCVDLGGRRIIKKIFF